MSRQKEAFDLDVLIEGAEPTTPLPIVLRVQASPVRPYRNLEHLGQRVSAPVALLATPNLGKGISFDCPLCGGRANAVLKFLGANPFLLSCDGGCGENDLRRVVSQLAPLAFEVRDDVPYPADEELRKNVLAEVNGSTRLNFHSGQRVIQKLYRSASKLTPYEYTGPDGSTILFAVRADKATEKSFHPFYVAVDASDLAELTYGWPDGLLPPFGWGQLVARPDAPVLIVEGEGTAESAASLFPDHIAMTSACGARSAAKTDWSPLAGRDVTIWRDNDEAGKAYERAVAAHCIAVGAKSVKAVTLPAGLSEKWDLADPLPLGITLEQIASAVANATVVRWDDVKDALAGPADARHWPPFRLPDSFFSRHKKLLKAAKDALDQIDPGCGVARWLAVLGALHHAFGDAAFEMADAWSRRDAERHGKYHEGEVRRVFDAFTAAPRPNPLPMLAVLRMAMKESWDAAGDDAEKQGKAWKPEHAALALAYIAEFESRHRKVSQGNNVDIGIQERRADGSYSIRIMSENNAESLYLAKKAPDFEGNKTSLFKLWQHNQLIEPVELVFEPGREVGPNQLNLFRGLGVQARQGGSYRLFRQHIDYVMTINGDTAGYLWNIIAYRLQNLATFVPALLVLIGPEGGGKSTITSIIARLLAPYSVALSDPEKFVGRNNAGLQGKLFVQLEEMILGKREEYDSRMKHYVTSPTLDVEEKYKANWQISNRLFIAMTANKNTVVRVGLTSRRFAMYEVADRFSGDQAKREEFFGAMWAELESGGLEALLDDLLRTDLTGFSPAVVPKTKLFQEMVGVAADSDPVRSWWREMLEKGQVPEALLKKLGWTDPILKEPLYRNYVDWCEASGTRARQSILSKAEWAKALGRLLPGGLPARRMMVSGTRDQFIVLPTYADCCDFFEALFGGTIDRAPEPTQLKAVM